MKNLLQLQEKTKEQEATVKERYNLSYIHVYDDSCTIKSNGITLEYSTYSFTPTEPMFSYDCPTTIPVTTEEMQKMLDERKQTEEHLLRVLEIWKKAAGNV